MRKIQLIQFINNLSIYTLKIKDPPYPYDIKDFCPLKRFSKNSYQR